jgi:hypothetical protein
VVCGRGAGGGVVMGASGATPSEPQVGDIVPCVQWSHYDHCGAPECSALADPEHKHCDWCLGHRRLRVTAVRERVIEVEPLAPAPEQSEATHDPA